MTIQTRLSSVKQVIAIASAKGGVGKSTTAVNLALALQTKGYRIGLLDADIYGPNQPYLLHETSRPTLTLDKRFKPVVKHGLQTMSMGYLMDPNVPMVWRGPMVSKALQQLLLNTDWQEVDVLLIDMPPGTGDIQLTLIQTIKVDGVVIVTTPHDMALLDARKGLEMFRKVDVPLLGVVENMSTYICTHCAHEEAIFGGKGAEHLAAETEVTFLGAIPLDKRVSHGVPIAIEKPDSDLAKRYQAIVEKMLSVLHSQKSTKKFPGVVVEYQRAD